jgi:hypothetical protein
MSKTNSIIHEGVVARYCKYSTLDEETGRPTGAAFQRRQNEQYLSVYLLDFFSHIENESEQVGAVKNIMQVRGWQFRPNEKSLFATLNVVHASNHIRQEASELIQFRAANLPHCGIFHEADDLLISELLAECVESIYPTREFAG